MGFGLFGLAEHLRSNRLDRLAAAMMTDAREPEHWTVQGDDDWQWYERESWVGEQWINSGMTLPVNLQTGEPAVDTFGYLDEGLVPKEVRVLVRNAATQVASTRMKEPRPGQPHPARQARHGRPPSRWLRRLNAEELRIWLDTIDIPNAGVCGMTFWEHLTRDHGFNPVKIDGLEEAELAKLHSAAHYGY